MRAELQHILTAAKELPAEDLPHLLGELEEIRCTAWARINGPAVQPASNRLLSIDEAAVKLGVSKDYLYRHHSEFPFTRRIGRALKFAQNGIEKYLSRETY